ncbi:MAG: hypothetical protein KDK34_23475 [Leptospiraceae bacterium]|nr:hypothetical protein [Leptospiraceae bacterium]
MRRLLLVFLAFVSVACFDYRERVVFNANFSGYVQINYTVPVYPEENRSLIAFLPASEEAIREKYERFLNGDRLRLSGILIDYFEKGPDDLDGDSTQIPADSVAVYGDPTLLRRFARVRYQIFFDEPETLELVLPGRVVVQREGRRLRIDRSFPISKLDPDNLSRVVEAYHRMSVRSLEKHSMRFSYVFPEYFDSQSNRVDTVVAGERTFELPLARTITDPGRDLETDPGQPARSNIEWNVRLIANPRPRTDDTE